MVNSQQKKPEPRTNREALKRVTDFFWRRKIHHKIMAIIAAIVILFGSITYGVSYWYLKHHANEPLTLGATFIPDYAESFGLDPHKTLEAILGDLGFKRIRLVSYWKDIEPTPGKYDFSNLDWQVQMAQQHGAKVSLAIGLRQPRWPECHEPKWVDTRAAEKYWKPQLLNYMTAVVNRYKDNPSIQGYELENEYFMNVFGECKNFDRDRLVEELNLVHQLDPKHWVEISRSNNWIGLPIGKPTPDVFGISVYKRVWDAALTHRYFEYPLPPWFYGALAGGGEIVTGKAMIIHELQAEPWAPNGKLITEIPVSEQYKSMNPERLKNRINYGENTGIRTIDLWGAEWWYWMKTTQHNPDVWNTVKQAVNQAKEDNQKLKN